MSKPTFMEEDLNRKIIRKTKWVYHLSQTGIATTEDKVRIWLMTYQHEIESRNAWIAPFSVGLSLLVMFVTTDFKDFIISREAWRGFFVFITLSDVLWLIYVLRQRTKAKTIDELISELKP